MTATAKKRSKAAQKAAQVAARADLRNVVFNLPNNLTWARLLLAAVMFLFIGLQWYWAAFWMFVIAASTDWLDGYFARKYNQVTTLGRILDPFADKVIICGTFIYLAAIPAISSYFWPAMAVIVVGRELLVTALRSFLEDRGADFSAKMAGKLKMVFQCFAAGAGLFYLDYAATSASETHLLDSLMARSASRFWLEWTLLVSVWTAVIMTVYSGAGYIIRAVRLLRT